MAEKTSSVFASWAAKLPKTASVISILAGLLVLAGWEFNSSSLRTLFLSQNSMRPNSALMHVFAGLALWMLLETHTDAPSHRAWRNVGRACAIVVLAIGALTFSEYLFGVNLHIDQLIFHDAEASARAAIPGRMAPARALNFLFFGSGILLLDVKKRRGLQLAEIFAFAILLQSMFGVFNYLLRPSVASIGSALSSSFICFVLGAGLLTARSHHQFRRLVASEHSGGAVFRRLIPAAVILPLAIASMIWWGEDAGLFARETGLILLAVMTITAFVLIVMWTMASLDQTDQARQAAAAELDTRERQQAAIAELGHRALMGLELAQLMDEGVRLVARTLGAEYCKIQELLPDGKTLLLRAGVGWREGLVGHATVNASPESQAGYVLQSASPVIVQDLRRETRFRGSPLLSEVGIVSGLSVIISGKDRPFGALGAHTTQCRSFTKDDVNFLQAAANVLAVAIERKRTEESLRRFNRALRTLSECDLAVVRATDERELVRKVCDILVNDGGYRMAWVGYARQDEAKTISPVAVAGADEGYLASAKITWADEEYGRGPTGTAIRSGRPCVVRNILEERNFAPWREDAAKHGYASTAALPLMVNGQPFGALRVYAVAPDAFDEEEMKLLAELAGDLAYGVQALRTRAERAQAAEALSESEERFRQMAENIREALWMVDAGGTKVLYVSPRCEDVWGRRPEAVYEHGLGWSGAVYPGDRDRLLSVLGGGIQQKEFETEYRVVWPDGSVHWVRDRTFPIRDHAGEVQRIVGVTEDITERRLAAEALYESEERYRQLFNEMNVGCALLEANFDEEGTPGETRFVEVNPTFEKLTGHTNESVIGKAMREIFPGTGDHWIERLVGVALTGESVHFEAYSVSLKKHLDVTSFRPRVGRFAVVFTDITERRQALEALEEAERKYRSIFENAMEGIFQATEDGRILTANPAMARILGYGTTQQFIKEVSNLEQHLYIEPRHPTGFIPLVKQQGAISEFETQMRRRDGTVIWVIGSAYAVRDDGGHVLYYEGTLRDITEHKKAEEALRQLSAQLLRAQDDERRRIARELHDSTGQNLAALAMNLAWINQSSAVWDAKLQAVLKESVDLVKRSLQEIRNFSYLLHPPVLDEYGLSAALQWYVQGFSQRSGIHVDVELPGELPRLSRQAETALFRVVQECLTNVHRHSGSPRAKVCLRQNFRYLTLEVSDEGQGMFAVSPEHAGAEARVGVGIAGMKERVRELGGQLEIGSDSRGTTVRASLPLAKEEVA
jgi:PAS domain S-box-containing protein